MQKNEVSGSIREFLALGDFVSSGAFSGKILEAAEMIGSAIKSGGKILIFGNGGSAADSEHMAAELMGRFSMDRKPYKAISLTANTPLLTALSNDYGYDECFSRQIEGLGEKGDVALGISTSGNSAGVLKALREAEKKGLTTIALLGNDGGKIKDSARLSVIVPSRCTPRIQEIHILIIHLLAELVEKELR